MQTEDQIYLSRRSLLRGAGGVLVGSGTLATSATSAAGFMAMPTRPELRCAKPRIVVYQSEAEQIDLSFSPLSAMDWVASQVGSVDLIAFHAKAHAVSSEDMVAISNRAAAQSCYVALGVYTAKSVVGDHLLIGPDGMVVAHGSHHDSLVCDTDLGRISLIAGLSPMGEQALRDVDLVIQSAQHNTPMVRTGSYVAAIMASARGAGSIIYAPDGTPITCAGAGWTQGIVATINVAGLRRRRDQEITSHA